MKFQNPLPVSVPKECQRAAKIFNSFVDRGNNGLDGVIPRNVLENAAGFAIFTVIKAGFLFSARGGSGVVIARLPNGKWSAPSAIGTAGLGVGTQAGAEITDFLVVLNSKSAVKNFMSAGSLTLGGNASIAVGPLGRNGEAIGALNTSGKMAAMYSYSKTKGLFGGVSIEGSVIMERQDANALAYDDDVTVKQLLSGAIPSPDWASGLIGTIEQCTGIPKHSMWVEDHSSSASSPGMEYAFSLPSPGGKSTPSKSPSLRRRGTGSPFSLTKGIGGSYFPDVADDRPTSHARNHSAPTNYRQTNKFDTHFESDYVPERAPINTAKTSTALIDFDEEPTTYASPLSSTIPYSRDWNTQSSYSENPFASSQEPKSHHKSFSYSPVAPISLKPELTAPLSSNAIARGIALHDFDAIEAGDLSFRKGAVIAITQKTDTSEDWWTGNVDGRSGIFPANFITLV